MGLLHSLLCTHPSSRFGRSKSMPNLKSRHSPSQTRPGQTSSKPMATTRTDISHPYPLAPRRRNSSSPEHRPLSRMDQRHDVGDTIQCTSTPEGGGRARYRRSLFTPTPTNDDRRNRVASSSPSAHVHANGRRSDSSRERALSSHSSRTYSPPASHRSLVLHQAASGGIAEGRKLRKILRVEGGWEVLREEEYGTAVNGLGGRGTRGYSKAK